MATETFGSDRVQVRTSRTRAGSLALATLVASAGILNAGSSCFASFLSRATPDGGKYHITAEEQSACGQDAYSYCSSAYPDEDRLLLCMRQNRESLSQGCRIVFDEGVKRRHLN